MDEARLNELVRRHTPGLRALASRVLGSAEEGEEVVQEAWVAVWRGRARVPASGVTVPWLRGVVLNLCRTRLRKRSRRRRLSRLWAQKSPPPSTDAQTPVEARILLSRVLEAVMELPRLQRDVLLVRYLDGLSTREAAEALGRAEGTVKAALHAARQTLRSKFGDTLRHALRDVETPDRVGQA